MSEIYHRSLGGRITFIDAMTRDEIEDAVKRAPWAWCETLRGFAPWPPDRVRGEPVYPPSLADTAQPRPPRVWDMAK